LASSAAQNGGGMIAVLEILWAGGERQTQRRVRPLANLGRRRCLHLDLGLVRSP
jgi:hypothetical protein